MPRVDDGPQTAKRVGLLKRRDGSLVWVASTAAAITLDGEPGTVGVMEDVTDRILAEAATRSRDAVLRGQREALEAALNNVPLADSLGALVRAAAEALGTGTRAAFYLANEDRTTLHHVVGMPDDYAEVVDGFAVGPESLACGLATATGRPVITPDVNQDARWEQWTWLAAQHGYRGCWSFPLFAVGQAFIGSLAIYSEQPRDDATAVDERAPFGGFNASGIGRQLGRQGMHEFTETHVMAVPSGG